MSPRAPRPWRPALMTCGVCGLPVRMDDHGYYVHVRRQPIKGGHVVADVRGRFRDA